MRKTCALVLVMLVFVFCIAVGNVMATGGVLLKTEDTGRYQIVILRMANSGSAGPNEVILLDKHSGRTWTLQSRELAKGWVLMPRTDTSRD